MIKFKTFLLLLFVLAAGTVFAIEIETYGEALIINDDKASAKAMALSRAKWAAVETVSPAKIKIDTIINNAELADEAVKTELSATIKSYSIIEETVKDNRYIIKIKANVIPEKTENLIDRLSNDTSICVMIAGSMPESNSLLFDQSFSSAVISKLEEKGFNVNLIDYSNITTVSFNAAFNNTTYKNVNNLIKNAVCRNILYIFTTALFNVAPCDLPEKKPLFKIFILLFCFSISFQFSSPLTGQILQLMI